MSINPQRYMHTPLYVNAVQVTKDNMAEVAAWCSGVIIEPDPKATENVLPTHIKVATIRPIRIRQTQAFVNDWVLETAVGFKVYTPRAFKDGFTAAPEETSDPKAVQLLEEIFSEPTLPKDNDGKVGLLSRRG